MTIFERIEEKCKEAKRVIDKKRVSKKMVKKKYYLPEGRYTSSKVPKRFSKAAMGY